MQVGARNSLRMRKKAEPCGSSLRVVWLSGLRPRGLGVKGFRIWALFRGRVGCKRNVWRQLGRWQRYFSVFRSGSLPTGVWLWEGLSCHRTGALKPGFDDILMGYVVYMRYICGLCRVHTWFASGMERKWKLLSCLGWFRPSYHSMLTGRAVLPNA